MISFRVREVSPGRWEPDFPGLGDDAYFASDGSVDHEAIRESLFTAIDGLYPGVYTLERNLDEERDHAFLRIDRRSDALIQEGFPFEGSVFSLSVEAQVRYSTMLMLAGALPYPLTVNSRDDRSAVDLLSAEHTQQFCMTAMGFVKSIVDSGSEQKSVVRAMEDVNALAAYQDPR